MNILNNIKDFYEAYKDDLLIGFSVCIVILLVVLLVIVFVRDDVSCNCESEESTLAYCDKEENESIEEITTFYVEVKGEVTTPGVYEVTNESIINDLIEMAGGFTTSAYTNNINLSRKLSSEMVIYVYSKKEYKSLTTTSTTTSNETTTTCDCSSYDISSCTDSGQSEIVSTDSSSSSSSSSTQTTNDLVNINTATKEELMTLSGIGESKAASIIAYREENGNFASIEDIQNVSGIGSSVFENIKDYITV